MNKNNLHIALIAAILPAALLLLGAQTTLAGSATWDLNPTSDWNTAANWTPNTVPDGPTNIATFGVSNTTAVSISAEIEVGGIVFNSGASAYTVTVASDVFLFLISGSGITNNSGILQNFVADVDSFIWFTNSASAGSFTVFTNMGATDEAEHPARTHFDETSTAGNGAFTNEGGVASGAVGGSTTFLGASTAGNATITNNGGAISGAHPGHVFFISTSSAGNATLIANGGSGGGEGGAILFAHSATGGTSRVELFGNGFLEISQQNAPGITVGSIEGDGDVFLGARNLTVGSNNLSRTFSGVVQDGGFGGGTGGSLTKIGTGTLSLTNTNLYSKGTAINAGTLRASRDGALGGGNVSLTASGAILTLQNGATNNYIADTANLSIAGGSTVNLNFIGVADTIGSLIVNGVAQAAGVYGSAASSASHQLPQFAGSGTILVRTTPPKADFNEDGRPDWIFQNSSTHKTGVWFMNDGARLSSSFTPTLPSGWSLLDADQFGGAGGSNATDFLLYNPSTRASAIWYLNGPVLLNGVYGPRAPAGWAIVLSQDFNADGKPDLLLYQASTGKTAIWYLNGAQYTGGAYGPTLPAGWMVVGAGDFDRDNKADLLLYQSSTGRTAVWYLNGPAFLAGAFGPTLPSGWILSAVDDYNRDGKPDLALTKEATHQSAIWHLDDNILLDGVFGPAIPDGWMLSAPK